MYLICGISSESYSGLDCVYYHTREETDYFLDTLVENFLSVSDPNAKIERTETRLDLSTTYNDYFEVYEVFEVSEQFALIWHHAYDGVDFRVSGHPTFDVARGEMVKEVGKVLEKMSAELSWDDPDQIVIDDGHEWQVWDIVKMEV